MPGALPLGPAGLGQLRGAALYDVHGNLPALEAVLADVEREGFDVVVVGGDVVGGPMPAGVLDRLTALGLPVRWVDGNGDREVRELSVGASDLDPDDPAGRAAAFALERLRDEHLALLATFRPTVAVGGALFCHATPRSDTELLTALTPPGVAAEAVGRTGVVVCGHVHVQYDRAIGDLHLLNAGSVGMPYEGRPGAFWLELGPEPRHRRSTYDVDAASAAIRATGYPDAEDLIAESLLGGADPREVAAFFERAAGR